MARTHGRAALVAGLALTLGTATNVFAFGATATPRTIAMKTVERSATEHAGQGRGNHGGGGGSANLKYNGGNPGVVTGGDKVYVVVWGSQWGASGTNDPSGEIALLQSFYGHVGGSSWNASVTQYCQGGTVGAYTCSGGTPATNPSGMYANTWLDTAAAAPSSPTQSQIAAEAAKAAVHFGISPSTSQVVVLTASGNSMNGFATQWCAWHSSTSSSLGTIAYTYLPYITDAGASCGANYNNLGQKAGITIVGGHELAETETDIYPSGGWTDSGGAENGDKCAWSSGPSASVSMNGASFPVQSLWSNAANSGAGGCVLSYP